jgi:hypothetical protein
MRKFKELFNYSPSDWALNKELEERVTEIRESGAEFSKISEEYINQVYFDSDFLEELKNQIERRVANSGVDISGAEIDTLIERGFDALRKHPRSISSLPSAKRVVKDIFLRVIVPDLIQRAEGEEESMLPPTREVSTLPPKTIRRPGNRYSSRDLNFLVKIANRLDTLGLQREADLIDSHIRDLLDKKLKDYTYNWNVRWNDDGEESFHSESDVENEEI